MVKAIVTKVGNSFALRVPKSYIVRNELGIGDSVLLEDPIEKQDLMMEELIKYGRKMGKIDGIANPESLRVFDTPFFFSRF